jgi:hypothetical protein
MRAVFGIVSLLVVVAIVGLLARHQLQAVKTMPSSSSASVPAVEGATVREQAQNTQKQVQQDVQRALEQGAAARASEPQ